MKKSLLEIEHQFSHHYRELLNWQKVVKAELETYPFDLGAFEMTGAIVERMYAFWDFHSKNNKGLLGRETNPVASDFFTETCLLYLKCYFKSIGSGYEVVSEKNIDKKKSRKSIKPDISIWRNGTLLAAIELKVSDGWKGKGIVQHLKEREAQIRQHHSNSYFGVLSLWKFSDKMDFSETWGSQYFALRIYQNDYNHLPTGQGIENLIKAFWRHFPEEAVRLGIK